MVAAHLAGRLGKGLRKCTNEEHLTLEDVGIDRKLSARQLNQLRLQEKRMRYFFVAAAILVSFSTPSLARDRHMSELEWFHKVSGFNYLHRYGPPIIPGTTFAYYDGPTINCAFWTAAYRGQDGKRHPC